MKTTLAGAGFAETTHWRVQSPLPFLGTPPSVLVWKVATELHLLSSSGARPL